MCESASRPTTRGVVWDVTGRSARGDWVVWLRDLLIFSVFVEFSFALSLIISAITLSFLRNRSKSSSLSAAASRATSLCKVGANAESPELAIFGVDAHPCRCAGFNITLPHLLLLGAFPSVMV